MELDLSIQDKIQAWEFVLESIEPFRGICDILREWVDEAFDDIHKIHDVDIQTSFAMNRPPETEGRVLFWWNWKDTESRRVYAQDKLDQLKAMI